jgi:hypothetical protein
MAANPHEERQQIVDLQVEGSAFGIPDAKAIRGKEREERKQHDAEKLGREAHGVGPFRL